MKDTKKEYRKEIREIYKDFTKTLENETNIKIKFEKHRFVNLHQDEDK